MNNPIKTTEYLQTNTGEKFYPKTIDSQVEFFKMKLLKNF